MEIFNQVIQMLSKEEVRHFKLFSQRTETREQRKDLELFDYVRKAGETYHEDKIFRKLYEGEDKNSFYRLKNRLLSDVNKSIVLQHLDDDENLSMFHLLSLGRYFRSRNNFRVAQYYIRKAEKKAIQLESYELLDFIYSELIQLSHEIFSINPEEYILKRKENREKLNQLRQVEDILAAVIYRLKVTQNFAAGEKPLFDLLKDTVDDFAENPAVKKSPKLRFTLYQAVSRILLSRHDYPTLEAYLLKTWNEFLSEGLFNKGNHETKLQMLTYIVNSLNRNYKTDESLRFCEKLREAMEEYNRLLYKKYLIFYYNGLVINYSRQKEYQKSISILEEAMQERLFEDNPAYECLFLVNLSVSYFNAGKFHKAMKALVQVQIHDGFKTFDDAFKVQLAIFELMLRVEIGDPDTLQKRIEKVRKEFSALLSLPVHARDMQLIRIVTRMADSPDLRSDKKLQKEAKDLIRNSQEIDPTDATLIQYSEWLKEKLGLNGTESSVQGPGKK